MHHIMIIYAYIYPPYYRDISYFVSMRFIFLMIWIYSFCDRVGQGVRPYSHTGKIFNAYPMEVKQTTIEIYTYIYIIFYFYVLSIKQYYLVYSGIEWNIVWTIVFFPLWQFLTRCVTLQMAHGVKAGAHPFVGNLHQSPSFVGGL